MIKRNALLTAAIAAAFAGTVGVANAGTITAGNVSYSLENIASTATNVTLGNVVYTMGVARTTAQDFVIMYTLPAGVLFTATPAVPAVSVVGAATVTLKRGGIGTNEVVYDVDVTTAFDATTVLTLTAPVINTHGLISNGATVSLTMALKDPGETSYVDNVGTLSSVRATAAYSADFWNGAANGVTADAATTTDVNVTVPLAGFIVANDDTATIAKATVQVKNTTAGVKKADNSADYTLVAGDLVTLTVTDVTGFLGLATNGLCDDLNNGGTCTAGANTEIFTISGNTGTLTGLAGNNAGFSADRKVFFTSDATTPMGTSRVLGIAGSVAPAAGQSHTFTGRSDWWTWTSNGTLLQSPWFSTAAGYTSRFVLTNTGTNAATYTAVVKTETGNTCTTGSGAAGTIPANGQLVVDASTICTAFSGANKRGAAVFTVNAPSANIQGAYNIVNATTGSVSVSNMMRPGTN